MGCAIATPACADATGTVCADDRPAVCVSPGKAVVAQALGVAFYPVLVHRPVASLPASSPRPVTLTQL